MKTIFSTKLFTALFASITTFHLGFFGLSLNRDNILKTLMSLELLLLSVNLNFIIFSQYLDDIVGQIFVVFILSLSAAESAIGLAILSVFYEKHRRIEFDTIKSKNKSFKVSITN